MRIYTHIILSLCFLFVLEFMASAEPISLNFENANIFDVVRSLSQKANFNLVITSDLNLPIKRINLHMKNIDPLEAIDYILSSNGYSFQKSGNTIIVSTLPNDLKNSAYRPKTEEIRLKYALAETASNILNKTLPELSATAGNTSSSLILKGKQSDIEEAKQLVSAIDSPRPQVLIESKIVEIAESAIQTLGISWGKENGTFKFLPDRKAIIKSIENMEITLNALVTAGQAKVIANPKISTIENKEAVINIGSKIPYAVPVTSTSGSSITWAVQYIDAGVNLKITPSIGHDNLITAKIHLEVSSITEWRSTAAGDFPVISTRNADATVQVKDGETIAVGGLINELDRKNLLKVPILGNIPLLGMLFQKETTEKTRSEIVFLITPHIL